MSHQDQPAGHAPARAATIPALDGLRGLAVIGVLLFHDGRLQGGFLGVDLFFALSGMLITGLLIEEWNRTSRIDLRRFWSRRFRRLLPALTIMLMAIVPMMRLWGSPAQIQAAKDGVVPGLFYLSNWQQISHSNDYWALFTDPSPLTHLWSLAVEAQFYLAWPALFILIARLPRWRPVLGVTTAVLAIGSAILMWQLFDPRSPTRSYVGSDTRAASLLAGALVAIVGLPAMIARLAERFRRTITSAQLAMVGGLAIAWGTVDGATSTLLPRGGYLLHSCACAVLAASLGLARPTILQRLLGLRPLRLAGLVSYGWYLWHWPVYLILSSERADGWGLGRWQLSLLRWLVSLAIAVASYFIVEMPIRRRTMLTQRFSGAMAFITSLAIVATLSVVISLPNTSPKAFDPTSIGRPSTSPSTQPTATADGSTPPASTQPRRVVHSLIWEGDSVAHTSWPGIVAAFGAAGVDVIYRGYPGTGFVPRPGADTFKLYLQPVLDTHPDVVVYLFSGWDSTYSEEKQTAWFQTYTQTILDTGAALVFVTHPPVDTTKTKLDTTVMRRLATELAAERPNDVILLDADQLWGPFAYDVNGDGVNERMKDGAHMCPQGSALLANWLVHELAARFDGIVPADPAGWASEPWTTDSLYDTPPGSCR
ncbi:MAG: acyltransferase family protein [Actinomycetota bacterium]|nr:acyltransferase family protein [Actinomycetota bacterium]